MSTKTQYHIVEILEIPSSAEGVRDPTFDFKWLLRFSDVDQSQAKHNIIVELTEILIFGMHIGVLGPYTVDVRRSDTREQSQKHNITPSPPTHTLS